MNPEMSAAMSTEMSTASGRSTLPADDGTVRSDL